MLQQHLFYTNKDPKNYLSIGIDTSVIIVTWKLTKNCSHIISDRLLSSYSLYSGNSQRFKLDVESSSILVKHIKLFYYLIRRLLFTSKITRLNVLDYVTYVLTMMELPTNYHKNRNLNMDLLFMKKTQMFVLSNTEY